MTIAGRLGVRGLAAALAGLFALCASGGVAYAGDSAEAARAKIEQRLSRSGIAELEQVEVEVTGDVATLRGVAYSLVAKRKAEKAARKEVATVNNLITVFPEARPEVDLRADVRKAVLNYSYLTVFDSVELGIDDGVVVLTGSVRDDMRRNDLEDLVAYVAGVRDVKNELRVQPASTFDDRLRRQLYLAIYGDRLRPFAGRPDGPVRIVVDNGRVTLTGWVNNEVDRQVFGNLAKSTLAFQVTNRIKVDGEAPAEDSASPKSVITI